MGYQFLHIEGYARHGSKQGKSTATKWSIRDIAAEAEREPDACPHVEAPQPPTVLFGCSPSEAGRLASDWGDASQDAQGRKLRSDGLCLAAGVVSLPNEQKADWPLFRDATVAWLQEQYGPRLRSVVEHTDEAHPHLHFYAVALPGERFEVLHPGRQAAAKKAQQGGKKGAQNAEYKKAMQGWQDGFQSAVAAHFGLTRVGPKKRRLTRGAWVAEQKQAQALARVETPPDLQISAADVAKRVTRKRMLGDEYETSAELSARLTALVREQARPLAAQAARAEFSDAQTSRLVYRVRDLEKTDNTQRAVLAEIKAAALLQELEATKLREARAEKEAQEWREAMERVRDELEELKGRQYGHDLDL